MSDTASSEDIAIIGRACRLPGAASVAALWQLLIEGRCAVRSIPDDRWPLQRHWHPRPAERGRTYTWAAGVLDDIWGFDAAAFGISPREAEQMDPQQRLLLELTWEALEDAGLPPSTLAGSDVGVFVGASSVDHANLRLVDMAAADAYMMTGNTLSVVSNRISYIFDLHGPSFTVDTACSSSLVAVHAAMQSLRSGRIDTAIVAGVNLLVSPQPFIGFSQAAMLSKRGLCHAFGAQADGYVRAEGGVALVLRTNAAVARNGDPIHGMIVAADVNSDGRTNGISLPSKTAQAELLDRLYRRNGIHPSALAFVEAHGTGTPVGDPIEATAIGEALGRRRDAPLPIGSIKTNIGHMEAAAGLGGLLKAMLALEHDRLPPSLHCDPLNPAIDFDRLNIAVAREPIDLATARRRLAGVNAFGFGGTNAHVVLANAPATTTPPVETNPSYLVLSAHGRAALASLAGDYAARLRACDGPDAAMVVAAAARKRDRLAHRIVMPFDNSARMAATLETLSVEEAEAPSASRAFAPSNDARVAFVFSGNGSQFAGMGLPAYRHSAVFREHLDTISSRFAALAGWSIVETLHAQDLAERLRRTCIAQPLLFAIQSAACQTLRHHGLEPAVVLGHSVGEVAAAEAAGHFDEKAALRVIYARSLHQERTYDRGGMAVVIGSTTSIEAILEELPGIEIAARNSSRAVTVSGNKKDLARLAEIARRHAARVRPLDLAYPFHSALMSPIEAPLVESLIGLTFRRPRIPFISTVAGDVLEAGAMDAHYWWRNVRDPVLFADAIERAHERNVGIFVEIGPAPLLLSHVGDLLEEHRSHAVTMGALERRDKGVDPLAMTVAAAIARGAAVDEARAFGSGPVPGAKVVLPTYPWQRQTYRLAETIESAGVARPADWHPLIGARTSPDRLEWQCVLDTTLHPWLADHCVAGRPILPGAAFVEMAFAVARQWCGIERACVSDLEILAPLQLPADSTREVLCRLSPVGQRLEIMSRPRLSVAPWETHATAKIIRDSTTETSARIAPAPTHADWVDAATIYDAAGRTGLVYGPNFRKLARACCPGPGRIQLELTDAGIGLFGIDPTQLDACFQALLLFADRPDGVPHAAHVPVRFGELALYKPGVAVASAQIETKRYDRSVIAVDIIAADAAGETVAILRDARFRPLRTPPSDPSRLIVLRGTMLASEPTASRHDRPLTVESLRAASTVEAAQRSDQGMQLSDEYVLLDGWATSLTLQAVRALAVGGAVDLDDLVASGTIPEKIRPWMESSLLALQRSGLCRVEGRTYVPDIEASLPRPDEILSILARNHQSLAVELLVAASTQAQIEALTEGEAVAPIDKVVGDFEMNAAQLRAPAELILEILRSTAPSWPRDRAMRILQLGHGPLTRPLANLARATSARLTIHEPDRRRLDVARAATYGDVGVVERIDDLPAAAFDLVVASASIARCLAVGGAAAALRRAMGPEAVLAAIEPHSSFFRELVLDFQFCLNDNASPRRAARSDWQEIIADIGLEALEVQSIRTAAGGASLLTGRTASKRRRCEGHGALVILGHPDQCTRDTAFATLLASAGVHVAIVDEVQEITYEDAPAFLVFVGTRKGDAPAKRLLDECLRLKKLVERIGDREARLWLVADGGANGDDGIVAGLWSFSRSLANERAKLDVRRVEIAHGLLSDAVVERLRDLVLAETDETDIILEPDATRIVRFTTEPMGPPRVGTPTEAARLVRGVGAERVQWISMKRQAPGKGEVEIAVEAVGINFRDVMFGLGLLPDDLLEDGFTGPALGLECVGRVLAVGSGVTSTKPGDRVMAFARNAFATHVVTPVSLTAPIPKSLTTEAAATIPVAFMTAYYGLITCARLKPCEWVLIHGGAGGVGLAALQIARWRGARVVATAGSPGRRALLRALGAEYAFDSRSGSFVGDVQRVTDAGVSVVLNSLSGEAMERSIGLLRPFGRFVELGKRDYVTNTHVGLRPFRRNLTYFGVDLDQLLVGEPATCQKLFRSVMRLFADGTLQPLPFRTVDSAETIDAFRLMQQSGHVGKLILRPPDPTTIDAPLRRETFCAAADKTHVVTGGFGGFGLATAQWLASVGAKTIVLVGRSGVTTQDARATIDALQRENVRIVEVAADVSDKAAMKRLFARFGRELPPLSGIVHAAMILRDAIVTNLDREQIASVLRPKVAGADLLDRLTRDEPLDYFLLYSSITTFIGNPGQAAYVAANGYLEGLARRRRRAGLPGLAVAWGAIADAGILARSESTRDLLQSRGGVKALPASVALDRLGEILADPAAHDAVVAIAPMSWSTARQHLPILSTPPYRDLVARNDVVTTGTEKIDVTTLIAGATTETARKRVAALIVEEIARVLRLPAEDVARTTPLAEIGLDSLMAVELALGLEGRFQLAAPLTSTATSFSVNELADHMIAIATGSTTADETVARHMIDRHIDERTLERAWHEPQRGVGSVINKTPPETSDVD